MKCYEKNLRGHLSPMKKNSQDAHSKEQYLKEEPSESIQKQKYQKLTHWSIDLFERCLTYASTFKNDPPDQREVGAQHLILKVNQTLLNYNQFQSDLSDQEMDPSRKARKTSTSSFEGINRTKCANSECNYKMHPTRPIMKKPVTRKPRNKQQRGSKKTSAVTLHNQSTQERSNSWHFENRYSNTPREFPTGLKPQSSSLDTSSRFDSCCQQALSLEEILNFAAKFESENAAKTTSPYLTDILAYQLEKEKQYKPSDSFLNPKLTNEDRERAIECISLIATMSNFSLTTVFTAVNILERALSRLDILKSQMGILSVTALFMSAKYEEVAVPKLSAFVHMIQPCKGRSQDIEHMEYLLLQALHYDLAYVSPIAFIDLFCEIFDINVHIRQNAYALCKKSLLWPQVRCCQQSMIALSCIYPFSPHLGLFQKMAVRTKLEIGKLACFLRAEGQSVSCSAPQ